MRILLISTSVAFLAGCVSLPDVPIPQDRQGNKPDYPDFAPLETLIVDQKKAVAEDKETEEELEERVSGLKKRAKRLRKLDTQ